MDASEVSTVAAPGSRRMRAKIEEVSADFPVAICLKTMSAATPCAACRICKRSAAGFVPPTAVVRSHMSSKSVIGISALPLSIAAHNMLPKLDNNFFCAVIRFIALDTSRHSVSFGAAARTIKAFAAAGRGNLLISSFALAMMGAMPSTSRAEFSSCASFSSGGRKRTDWLFLLYSQVSQWPSKYVIKSSLSQTGFCRIFEK
mmetsp:Transcript_289/g.814  ORF Transcript_289/g.814 Transcript_289/m.814 type:complete len:202 (+) Transcript_289:163-768(+)